MMFFANPSNSGGVDVPEVVSHALVDRLERYLLRWKARDAGGAKGAVA